MKYSDQNMVMVYEHRGYQIYTLKVAKPQNGDPLGYFINNAAFAGKEYALIQNAIDAIEEQAKMQDVIGDNGHKSVQKKLEHYKQEVRTKEADQEVRQRGMERRER